MSEHREWRRFSERWRSPWHSFIPLSLLFHLFFAAIVFLLPSRPVSPAAGSPDSVAIPDTILNQESSPSEGEGADRENGEARERIENRLRDAFEELAADHLGEEESRASWEEIEEDLEEEIGQFEELLLSIAEVDRNGETAPLEDQVVELEEAWKDLKSAMVDEFVEFIDESATEESATEPDAPLDGPNDAEILAESGEEQADPVSRSNTPPSDNIPVREYRAVRDEERGEILAKRDGGRKKNADDTERMREDGADGVAGGGGQSGKGESPEKGASGAEAVEGPDGPAYFVPPELVEIGEWDRLAPAERIALAQTAIGQPPQRSGPERGSDTVETRTEENAGKPEPAFIAQDETPASAASGSERSATTGKPGTESAIAAGRDRKSPGGKASPAANGKEARISDRISDRGIGNSIQQALSMKQEDPSRISREPPPPVGRTRIGDASLGESQKGARDVRRPGGIEEMTSADDDSNNAKRQSETSGEAPGTSKGRSESALLAGNETSEQNAETSSGRASGAPGARESKEGGSERGAQKGLREFEGNELHEARQIATGDKLRNHDGEREAREEWLSALVRQSSQEPGSSVSGGGGESESKLREKLPEGSFNELIHPALVVVPAAKPSGSEEFAPPAEREPDGGANRYAVAPFRSARSVRVDGELSEWKNAPRLTLDRPRGGDRGTVTRPSHQTAWIAHSPDAILLAADVVDTSGKLEKSRSLRNFWENDALEIYIDSANSKEHHRGLETHQFVVFPFDHDEMSSGTGGYEVLAEREDGKVYWSRASALSKRKIRAAGRRTSRGWSIEVMLDKSLLRGKKVDAETIIGFNLQVDTGSDLYFFWNAEPKRRPSHYPDTWGTVKLLARGPEVILVDKPMGSEIKAARPGRPLHIRVADPEASDKSQISVIADTGGGDSEKIVLKEVDRGSGVFEGGIPTRLNIGVRAPEVLELYEGEKFSVEYSHRNDKVTKRFPVSSFGRQFVFGAPDKPGRAR